MDHRASACNACRPTEALLANRGPGRPARSRQQAVAQILSSTVLNNGCHLATVGTLIADGYRRTEIGGVGIMVHRLVYEEVNQTTLAPAMTVDHLCHNADYDCPGGPTCLHRQCVNPVHLGEATLAENWTRADTWRRRRSR